MVTHLLTTQAERVAVEAQDLDAFGGLNLVSMRKSVDQALQHIHAFGLFVEYTKHDSAHIDAMLNSYDWMVPEATREAMTPADWLLLVLSTYFHDFGMLVTRDEYEARHNTDFPSYLHRVNHSSDANDQDYRANLKRLSSDELEKFHYQEFVRANHARRIRSWLSDHPDIRLGYDDRVTSLLKDLMSGLEPAFVDDLALVCESHHRNDLDDLDRYPIDKPYGQSPAEAANVQYIAILLRSADLLHITRDRTPAVAFRVINPKNPSSLLEWEKQQPVLAVRPKRLVEAEGDTEAPPIDTIEVHALFTEGRGFFGLTSYLQYAGLELRRCSGWARDSARRFSIPYAFPWRNIDTTNVKAKGFVARQFEFRLDQHKVLDLLTGHTIYNDTGVVVRELVQNSIDAVRLQKIISGTDSYEPRVQVRWRQDEKVLEVLDNGTGMSEAIINDNFLHVGASRYQSESFRQKFPKFSSISRFGIGVLSAFMVSDDIKVLTSHPDDDEAREISLESVHGQYLMRLLPKTSSELSPEIREHGTLIRLRVRESASLEDIRRVLLRWVIIPGCRVEFESGETSTTVGFETVTEALETAVKAYLDIDRAASFRDYRVRSYKQPGLEVAYVVEWNQWYEEFALTRYPRHLEPNLSFTLANWERHLLEGELGLSSGSLIEGIRVTSTSPGMVRGGVWALANATGLDAPKTNVARTALENSPELDRFIRGVFAAYVTHVHEEVRALQEERGRSLTRAVFEAPHISAALSSSSDTVTSGDGEAYIDALRKIPVYVLEDASGRRIASCDDVLALDEFATVDNEVVESVDYLLSSITRSVTMREVFAFVGLEGISLPAVPVLRVGASAKDFTLLLLAQAEVTRINADSYTTLECRWRKRKGQDLWVSSKDARARRLVDEDRSGSRRVETVLAPLEEVPFVGPSDVQQVRVMGNVLLLHDHPAFNLQASDERADFRVRRWFAAYLTSLVLGSGVAGQNPSEKGFRDLLRRLRSVGALELFDESSVVTAISQISRQVLDPRAAWRGTGWSAGSGSED